jgi:RNA polymerase sigma-32 factor
VLGIESFMRNSTLKRKGIERAKRSPVAAKQRLERAPDERPLVAPEHALAPASPSLATLDPLSAYLSEVRRYPLVDRDEERALALRYRDHGDLAAARRLVTANLRLVVKIAYEYQRASRNLLDLIQEGNLGLLLAVRKYDPDRGVRLSSYAVWWMRAYMLRYLLDNARIVKLGTTPAQRKLFFNLRKEKQKLEALGFVPSPDRVAAAMHLPEHEVVEMERRLGQGELSLDGPAAASADGEDRLRPIDVLQSPEAERPDVAAEADEFRARLREELAEFARTLQGREATLFRERLLSEAPRTLEEIGRQYGISRERARQVEQRLVARLRDHLSRGLGDAVSVGMQLAA